MKGEILRFLSVGIDIGTSTTCLIFSNLTMEDVAPYPRTPDVRIVEKTVLYRSPMHFTPLRSDTELDTEAIAEIIAKEYRQADISPKDVQTGAVIITGDTARKNNAESVLRSISAYAGDFVVATAGPDFESILSGKGSGAAQYSIDTTETISNYDVGGGTTNIATFFNGRPVDVDCMDIGGRLIRFRNNSMEIEYVFPKIRDLAYEIGIDAQVGRTLSDVQAEAIADRMAEAMLDKLAAAPSDPYYYKLLTEEGKANRRNPAVDVISFSGGVGDLIYKDALPDNLAYGDIGVFLARSIKALLRKKSIRTITPSETIGATVIGAGSHSMDVSGATVTISHPDVLPLTNIPVLKIADVVELSSHEFAERVQENAKWLQGLDDDANIALNVEWGRKMDYASVRTLAEYILGGMKRVIEKQDVLIVITADDFGKVLGQTLQAQLPSGKKVVCIDSVDLGNGDYIDIGKPLGLGDAVPIVVKTIAFNY